MPIKPTILALCTGISAALMGVQAPHAFANDDSADSSPALRAFNEAYSRIKDDFVDEVDAETLRDQSIRGMLKALDPHSKYLDPKEYVALRASNSGEYGGLGIRIGEEDGRFKVIAPMADTPAKKAGVLAGDWIVGLDGNPLNELSMREVRDLMRGKPGTDIELTLQREGEIAPISLVLTRAKIETRSVNARLLDNGIGYVRLSRFQSRSDEDLIEELQNLQAQSDNRLGGLVLDLRNNPGGLVSSAVAIADAFLKEGTIVSTNGRRKGERTWTAQPDDLLLGAPMVVLVNERSASSSEIVAGALQDHKRATIVGTKTYGKGSVQSILPLRDGGALKLTTARYYTPAGRSIHGIGITPDVLLSASGEAAGELEARMHKVAAKPSASAEQDPGLDSAVKLLMKLRGTNTAEGELLNVGT